MISVIGAGPAGSYAAYLLAKEGKDVCVFEEHADIGKPVQCTGIVTGSINSIIRLKKDIITNKISKAVIHSPDKSSVEFKLKDPNLIIDRQKFDSYLADMAISKGAKIFLRSRFVGLKKEKGRVVSIAVEQKNSIARIKATHLVGADGPHSAVARASGMYGKRKFWTGIQVRVRYKNDNEVEFFPHIGSFAWAVPEDENTARIGLLATRHAKEHFLRLLKEKGIGKKSMIEIQGGIVPYYNPSMMTENKNVFLIGDAATQVKATTGGGIIQGLTAAGCLKKALTKGESYEKLWKKELNKDLMLHLKMRNVMDSFSDKEWDYLVKIMSKERNRKVLEENDRDYPKRFLAKLIIQEPRFLYFAKKALHLI